MRGRTEPGSFVKAGMQPASGLGVSVRSMLCRTRGLASGMSTARLMGSSQSGSRPLIRPSPRIFPRPRRRWRVERRIKPRCSSMIVLAVDLASCPTEAKDSGLGVSPSRVYPKRNEPKGGASRHRWSWLYLVAGDFSLRRSEPLFCFRPVVATKAARRECGNPKG